MEADRKSISTVEEDPYFEETDTFHITVPKMAVDYMTKEDEDLNIPSHPFVRKKKQEDALYEDPAAFSMKAPKPKKKKVLSKKRTTAKNKMTPVDEVTFQSILGTQKQLDEIQNQKPMGSGLEGVMGLVQSQLNGVIDTLQQQASVMKKAQTEFKKQKDKFCKSVEDLEVRCLDQRKHVFATMLTNDSYLPGLQMLHFSLQKHVNRVLKEAIARRHSKLNDDLASNSTDSAPLDEEPGHVSDEDYLRSFSRFLAGRDYYVPFQLVVILASNISKVTEICIRKMENVVIKRVAAIPNPYEKEKQKETPSWFGSGYTKFYMWSLIEYELVFYIDADCLIQSFSVLGAFLHLLFPPGFIEFDDQGRPSLQSEDKLQNIEVATSINLNLEAKTILAAAPDVFPPDRFNAGVLLLRPSFPVFKDLLANASKLTSYDEGDTGFLNAYFSKWFSDGVRFARLPFTFNAQRTLQMYTEKRTNGYWGEVGRSGIKIIHYSSSPKPWEGHTVCSVDQIWKFYMLEQASGGN